jgi:hypothetical protein
MWKVSFVSLRHRHRKEFDNDIGVERLEDIFRGQGLVDTRVLVRMQAGQVFGTYVHHIEDDRRCPPTRMPSLFFSREYASKFGSAWGF